MGNTLQTISVIGENDCEIAVAGPNDLDEIVALQGRNMRDVIPAHERSQQGYVSLPTPRPFLDEVTSALPTIIARINGKLAGYLIAMTPDHAAQAPFLNPLVSRFPTIEIDGRPLVEHKFFVGAQMCIERGYRNLGILPAMFAQRWAELGALGYEVGITEVGAVNAESLRATKRMNGFEIQRFTSNDLEWVIIGYRVPRPQRCTGVAQECDSVHTLPDAFRE